MQSGTTQLHDHTTEQPSLIDLKAVQTEANNETDRTLYPPGQMDEIQIFSARLLFFIEKPA